MASWLEKLGLQRTRPQKEELKDFCLELCPDNRIASFMITDHTPRSGDPFIRFVRKRPVKPYSRKPGASPTTCCSSMPASGKRSCPLPTDCWRRNPGRYGVSSSKTAGSRTATPSRCDGPPIWRHTVWKRTAGTWRGWNIRQATKISWHTRPHGNASFKERTPGSS